MTLTRSLALLAVAALLCALPLRCDRASPADEPEAVDELDPLGAAKADGAAPKEVHRALPAGEIERYRGRRRSSTCPRACRPSTTTCPRFAPATCPPSPWRRSWARTSGSRRPATPRARRAPPPGEALAVNAYAIHGLGDARRYLAMTPLPGPAPDYHRIEGFEVALEV